MNQIKIKHIFCLWHICGIYISLIEPSKYIWTSTEKIYTNVKGIITKAYFASVNQSWEKQDDVRKENRQIVNTNFIVP